MNLEASSPEDGRPIEFWVSPEFLQDAAKRGVAPEVLVRRLTDLVVTMDREGAELFADWREWPMAKQLRWCLDGAKERARLEFPYLEEED